ncbi:hypothetical protein [Kitasatospora sp. NPDC057223]|uniref:hypothetical protein n=1 Tax=Kitasatospora sp. NPDC057223 TaxID=3346055 RepID=UPI0036266377
MTAAAHALLSALPHQAVMTPTPKGHSRRAALFTVLNRTEYQRRRTVHGDSCPPAIDNPEHLDLLLSVPEGMPVAASALTARQRALLRALPPTAASLTRTDGQVTHVTRTAIRPATVHLALVTGPVSGTNLGIAGSFAPFCPRAILAPERPRLAETLIEADFWGIGVAVEENDTVEVLVPPRPWKRMRHSPAGWRFEEQAAVAAAIEELQNANPALLSTSLEG